MEIDEAFKQAVRGMARLQARQEMLECIVRALIVEAPPAHPLFQKALHTAKSDLNLRVSGPNRAAMPQFDADAMQLWNVLIAACAPSSGDGSPH